GFSTEDFLNFLCVGTVFDYFATDLDTYCINDTENVSLGCRGSGSENEVSGGESVEVSDVAVNVVSCIEQFSQFFAGFGRLYIVDTIESFGSSQVVSTRTDTAETRCD